MKTLEKIIIQILEDTIGCNIVKLLEKLFLNIIGGNFCVKLLKDILTYNFYTTIFEDELCKTTVGYLILYLIQFVYNQWTLLDDIFYITIEGNCRISWLEETIEGKYCRRLLQETIVVNRRISWLEETIEGKYCRRLLYETIVGNYWWKLLKETIGGNYWRKLLKETTGGNY